MMVRKKGLDNIEAVYVGLHEDAISVVGSEEGLWVGDVEVSEVDFRARIEEALDSCEADAAATFCHGNDLIFEAHPFCDVAS